MSGGWFQQTTQVCGLIKTFLQKKNDRITQSCYFDAVILGVATLLPHELLLLLDLPNQFVRFGEALVGHSIREQQDVVVVQLAAI